MGHNTLVYTVNPYVTGISVRDFEILHRAFCINFYCIQPSFE